LLFFFVVVVVVVVEELFLLYLEENDGISKSLCATGVRVGWVFGPEFVIGKMTEIFSHIGAWSPKPEQNAVAKYFNEYELIGEFISNKIKQSFNEGRNLSRVILAKSIVKNNYTHETMIRNWEDYILLKIKECNDIK
jgi:aspartate aminotransferase